MNTYEVTSQISGKSVFVEARNENSAVKKAHIALGGKAGAVTWHGMHAEVGGAGRYARPARKDLTADERKLAGL